MKDDENKRRRPAVFIDRDGVLNENRMDYVKSWQEFVFLPDVLKSLRDLSQADYVIVVFSNQSAVGRGLVSQATVDEIHQRMLEVINLSGGRIDGIYYCPHRPEEGCDCRKPQPGLLFQAAEELDLDLQRSYVIGDAVSDIQTGLAVGCTPIFVKTGRGENELPRLRAQGFLEVVVVENLAQAVAYLQDATLE